LLGRSQREREMKYKYERSTKRREIHEQGEERTIDEKRKDLLCFREMMITTMK